MRPDAVAARSASGPNARRATFAVGNGAHLRHSRTAPGGPPARPEWALGEVGEAARQALLDAGPGRVLAVFERSFYVQSASGALVCVGPRTLGSGPLNALCDLPADWRWPAIGLRPGTPARRCGMRLHVGDSASFSFQSARAWRPPPLPHGWRVHALREGLGRLAREADVLAPAQGWGRAVALLGTGATTEAVLVPGERAMVRTAAAVGRALWSWLDGRCAGSRDGRLEPAFVTRALGLGPGLTPSGDDFLAGAMIALHLTGERAAARHLARFALARAPRLTNRISQAHLACAALGMGAGALHDALRAVLAPGSERLRLALDRIDRIGHTSGWDGLAGATAVLAWVSSRPGDAASNRVGVESS